MELIPLAAFLFERHKGLAEALAKRKGKWFRPDDWDDLKQVALKALWESAQSWSPLRQKAFPPYAQCLIWNRLTQAGNHIAKKGFTNCGFRCQTETPVPSRVKLDGVLEDQIYSDTTVEDQDWLEWAIPRLDKTIYQDIARRCWLEGLNIATVAHQLGMKENQIRSLLWSAHQQLKKMAGDKIDRKVS